MNKKLLSLILAGMMLVLPACNQTTDPDKKDTGKSDSSVADSSAADTSADTSADTEPDDIDFGYIDDGLPEKYDFEGAEYRIAIPGYEESETLVSSVTADEMTSDATDVMLYNASRTIEERFGCKIQNYNVDSGMDEVLNIIRTLVQSGDTFYSIFVDGALTLSQAFTDGIYYNLRDVEQFDFSKPWWTEGTEALSVGDRAYLGVSYLTYDSMKDYDLIFVNKEVADRYNITVPYEDVFNGTWTIDKLYNLASQATAELNGNNEWDEDDAYGFSYKESFTKQLQCALGVHIITKDADNRPVANLDVEAGVRYLSFMEKLEEYSCKVPMTDTGSFIKVFLKGNTLFAEQTLSRVYDLLETDILYGFLPVPKLDESQEEYETYSHAKAWIIPTTSLENIDFIGTITEALNATHFNDVRPVFFESTMKGRLAESPEDAQVLDIFSRSLHADFGFEFSQTITPIWKVRDMYDFANGNGVTSATVASTYKSMEKNLNNYINRLFLGKFDKMVAAEEKTK